MTQVPWDGARLKALFKTAIVEVLGRASGEMKPGPHTSRL
jgi:hypothetical protein